LFPNSRGFSGGGGGATGIFKTGKVLDTYQTYDDNGSAARFFYTAKASRKERTANGTVANNHPTVKPLALLRYLCRITKTPTGGMILDPFMGSGSTLIAALQEGREAIGIDISEGYCEIARQRIDALEPEQVEMQWQPT
jgi:DNA modification methylase